MVKFNTAVMTIMATFAGYENGNGNGNAYVHGAQLNSMSNHGNMMRNASASSSSKNGRGFRRADTNTNTEQTNGILKLSDDEQEKFLADFQARGLYAHRHRHLQTAIGWKPIGNEILSSSGADFDRAGNAVSMNFDGSRVAVASYLHNNEQGHVRVFDMVGDVWTQIGRDLDGLGGDRHGMSISLSNDGTRLAVGAPNHANYMGTTRVYTYDADSDSWIGMGGDIDGISSNDRQGSAVNLSGDGLTLAIGAPEGGSGTKNGYARLYKYDETRSRWTQFGNRLEGEYYHTVGSGCALNEDGTRVAIGGSFHPNPDNPKILIAGSVKVYQLDNSNPASPQWVVMGEGVFGSTYYEKFGDSVDINAVGDRIAIGATHNDESGLNAGKAEVYQWLEEEWVQLGSTILGLSSGDSFGQSISISSDGGRIAVGSPLFDLGDSGDFNNIGQARIFDYIFDDTPGKEDFDWVQVGPAITGECKNDNSSRALDMSKDGKRVIIGAPNNDYYNGHAKVYEATEGFTGGSGSSCFTFPPTPGPSNAPTDIASAEPTGLPTSSPSVAPSKTPTLNPTGDPTTSPTSSPSKTPTLNPTGDPTASPTSSPSAHPSNKPTPANIMVESKLLFEISLQGTCECNTETTAYISNYVETAWQMLVPSVEFEVDSIQCEGVCAASRGPGDRLDFIIDAVQSVKAGDEDLFVDPVASVTAINTFLVANVESIATDTGLPITGATAKAVAFPSAAPSAEVTISPQPTNMPTTPVPTKVPTKAPTKNPTKAPTKIPTKEPTQNPTSDPTLSPPPTDSPTKSPVKAPTPAPPTTSAGVSGYGSVGLSAVLASVSAVVFLVLN